MKHIINRYYRNTFNTLHSPHSNIYLLSLRTLLALTLTTQTCFTNIRHCIVKSKLARHPSFPPTLMKNRSGKRKSMVPTFQSFLTVMNPTVYLSNLQVGMALQMIRFFISQVSGNPSRSLELNYSNNFPMLPSKSTDFIQPLDISVMKYFKDRFKFHSKNKEYPRLRSAMQSDRQHVINCVSASILDISPELIKKGFQKMLTL